MIKREHPLPVTRQAELLQLSRASVYYRPVAVSAADLALMRRIDELHLELPFAGSRMLRDLLMLEGKSTATPGSWLRRTAVALKRSLYLYVVLGPGLGISEHS